MKSALLFCVATTLGLASAGPLKAEVLWTIGTNDNNNAEFAFAPKDYNRQQQDGFYVVGDADSRQDWPYAQPGPSDSWAGSRSHTNSILFGLADPVPQATCILKLDFLDTHSDHPPQVKVEINGTPFERTLPKGAGDSSIHGDASKGREFVWDISFPSTLLHQGANEILISTVQGSWLLYDCVTLETPGKPKLAAVPPYTLVPGVDVPPVWLKENDAAVQPISIGLRHYGEGVSVAIMLGDKVITNAPLKRGLQTVELRVPALKQQTTHRLRVSANGKEILSETLTLAPPRIREMWLLPHSHVDIGYTHRQDEIIDVQISNLQTAMRLARESRNNPPGMQFKWNPEAVWTLDHFLRRASASERQEFIEAVRRGDVGVDGLYGNLLTGLCRPEELAQGLAFGARISSLTGVPVQSASICDVPGWTWGIVPMMGGAGIKYFAIGPNYGARVGTIHIWDNQPFYWKSESGRERLLCWVVDNYHFFGDLEPHVLAQLHKLDRIQFPYDVSFMFWVGRSPNGAVDNAPPDPETVAKVVAWNAKYAAPKMVIGLAGEYFRRFERAHGSQVPEVSGDLTPYWEDGAGSTSRETGMNRATADRLSQAETLFAMRAPDQLSTETFDEAWKNVLLYSEHTWGAWCSISKPDDPFTLDQWKVKQAFALDADRQSRELLNQALNAGDSDPGAGSVDLDVFNTTQWPRRDIALVPHGLQGNSVLTSKGAPVLCQRLSSGELAFLAEDIPPFGAKRFRLSMDPPKKKGSATTSPTSLGNGLLTVDIDPKTGAIRSLRKAGLNHEFVDPNAPVAINDYRYVLGADAKGAQQNGQANIQVLENGPLVAALRIESPAPGCNQLTRDVRVIHGLDRVEIANHVDRKSVREKDGVHFGYGFLVPGGHIHMETPWAVVRPDLDQLPGACRNWFTVQRWVDVANSDCGITWASLDAPLMEIGGITANLLGEVNFSEWMTNALDSQTIYSWAQNNHWFTNYKIDQPGVTTFRFVLRPHQGAYVPINAARFGMESSRPLLVAPARGTPAPNKPLLKISSKGVLVETVKPSTDHKALIVRLFGVGGKAESVPLKWEAIRPASLWLTDLTERPMKQVGGKVEVPAYGVVHLRAELE